MIYYLEDTATKSVLAISDNIFLINNLSSGILDNHLRATTSYYHADKIQKHLDTNVNTGILFESLAEVDLENFEYTKRKLWLINLRKPLFEELLINVAKTVAGNRIGFSFGDEVFVQYALDNDAALEEYASVLNMSPEFAKKELRLISESAIKHNFRTFTIATKFKEKINKVKSEAEAEEVKKLLKTSFTIAGMVNV